MNITRVFASGADRPLCTHGVRVPKGMSTTLHRRHERERRGVPIDQCGERASYMVDGRARCTSHAGQQAVTHLLNATELEAAKQWPCATCRPFYGINGQPEAAPLAWDRGRCPDCGEDGIPF